jgi:hypothetical protein
MVISDNPKYVTILKGIAKHIKENQIESLCFGRQGIISFWIKGIKNQVNSLGEKSIAILTKDINHIIDKILGVEFQ